MELPDPEATQLRLETRLYSLYCFLASIRVEFIFFLLTLRAIAVHYCTYWFGL